jgi:hypothetical protein
MAVPMHPSRIRNITFIETIIAKSLSQPSPHIPKIDLVEGRREVPMKILCLGYSRTGTYSLFTALRILGYNPYHMAEAVKNAQVDLPCWADGVEQMFSQKGRLVAKGESPKEGKGWGKKELDKLTGQFDVGLPLTCSFNRLDSQLSSSREEDRR